MFLAYSVILATKKNSNPTPAEANKMAFFCIPPKMINKAYAQVFIDYMQKHPEEMNKDACSSVLNAFVQAFPCK